MFSFHLKIILFAFVSSFVVVISEAQTYTFSNAGAEGREGPTQEQIDANYSGTNLAGKVTINTRGIQEWVVPADGNYSIEATAPNGKSLIPSIVGHGAVIYGEFLLSKNETLKILVGQQGESNFTQSSSYNKWHGGSGGSFVCRYPYDTNASILVIAGGGAGDWNQNTENYLFTDASLTRSAKNASTKGVDWGNGGENGNGGERGKSSAGDHTAGGGGGFFTDGQASSDIRYSTPIAAKSFINGGTGGFFIGSGNSLIHGGFGGGGSGSWGGAGGAGGYSGGAGSPGNGYAGGGASFNSGINQNNTVRTDSNEGHGKVIITFLGSSNEAPMISQGVGPLNKVSLEDTQVSWSASELNATDSDTNAAQLSWSLLSSPSNGTAVVDGNGSSPEVFTYQPNANYHGSDSFSVQVSDGDANDSITINLTINPVDDPSVITGNTFGVLNEDYSLTGDLNATDIDGLTDGTYFSISSNATDGFATIDFEDGNWTYSPSANFYGSDSFSVIITDDDGNTTTQPINLTIHPDDDPSVITGNTSGVLNEDYSLTGDLNATDIEGLTDGSYFSVSTPPTNGTSSIDATDGNWTYSPSTNFYGNDSFSVTITDDDGNTSTQLISLTVNPVDDPAVVTGDTSAVTNEDTTVTGDLNATDSDGLTDGSYFSISSSPSNGALSLNEESGRWTYYPNSNAYGNDSFTVTITDDQGFTSTQAVSITINPANDSTSVTGDLNATINEDYSASGDLNASDIDGLTDGSYFSVSSNPSNGTASIDAVDGNWTYIPSSDFYGLDSFTITITDDQGYTVTQEISLIVDSIDDASSISGDINATISEDSIASGDLNASDIDGLTDSSYFSIFTNPSNGTALIDIEDGNWTYTPSSNFFGTDSFSVTITDDLNYTTTQAISVIINAVDDPSLITGDISGLLFLNHSVTGDLNASDMDGLTDASYFTIQTTPSFGTATVDPVTGSWIYNPQTGFLGDDSFVIQITDDQGFVANQAITLIPQYNVPVAQTESPRLSENDQPIFSGSILYNGGLPILEVGFETSSSSQFTTSTKHPVSLTNGSSTFTLELNQTELTSTIFVRTYARNQNGETLGEIKRLDPAPIVMQWSSHATVLDNGWMQSDWFGTFNHFPQNWIFHSRLDWLYIPDSTTEELWLWSPDHGWLWTGKNVFPHLLKTAPEPGFIY
jgi:VCBS repeat-containing protein